MRVRACVRVCGGCMWEGAYVHACVCVSVVGCVRGCTRVRTYMRVCGIHNAFY